MISEYERHSVPTIRIDTCLDNILMKPHDHKRIEYSRGNQRKSKQAN